jgi:uncharacterized protein
MKLTKTRFALLFSFLCAAAVLGQDSHPAAAQDTTSAKAPPAGKKLKVLYITGGGYHKYDVLTPIIVDGIKKHANVEIDVKWIKDKAPDDFVILRDPKLGEGYDAIIYNICHAGSAPNNTKLPAGADPELIANALRVTKEGKPTVMVHCSMHTFMPSDDWTDFCGMRTRRHDRYKPFGTDKATANHPAIKHFPDNWTTPGDELYNTIKLPETSTSLLTANVKDDAKNTSTVCWVHKYGNGNVFGTTLGHDEKTVSQDAYLRLLADGLLWACDKLDADGNPKPGYGGAE